MKTAKRKKAQKNEIIVINRGINEKIVDDFMCCSVSLFAFR